MVDIPDAIREKFHKKRAVNFKLTGNTDDHEHKL
jgi:hypothetical protein